MTYIEKDVSADPGHEAIPTSPTATPRRRSGERRPVVGGLGARADEPDTSRRLAHPEPLVGERPAKGSVENRG